MSKLFSPLTIKSVTFKNRIVVSPMCQYSCEDGFATDWHLVHLGTRAVGGAALIMQEATSVSPEGRISLGDAGIWKDSHIDKLKSITSFIHANGSIAGIQLAHAGRKGSTQVPWNGGKQIRKGDAGYKTVAPSAIPFYQGDEAPEELTMDGIENVVRDFQDAAARALIAGYKVLEIHAAHGYLIHQFLSPLSNHRTDSYGGSFQNRTRLLLKVIAAIRISWPSEFPLFVRVSSTDWAEGGWDIAQTVSLAKLLRSEGVDLIDSSSGGLVPHVTIPIAPGYQVTFADQIKNQAGILTGAVGLITEAKQAEQILEQQQADMIFIAREALRNPYFALEAAKELGAEVQWPVQYLRAK